MEYVPSPETLGSNPSPTISDTATPLFLIGRAEGQMVTGIVIETGVSQGTLPLALEAQELCPKAVLILARGREGLPTIHITLGTLTSDETRYWPRVRPLLSFSPHPGPAVSSLSPQDSP